MESSYNTGTYLMAVNGKLFAPGPRSTASSDKLAQSIVDLLYWLNEIKYGKGLTVVGSRAYNEPYGNDSHMGDY